MWGDRAERSGVCPGYAAFETAWGRGCAAAQTIFCRRHGANAKRSRFEQSFRLRERPESAGGLLLWRFRRVLKRRCARTGRAHAFGNDANARRPQRHRCRWHGAPDEAGGVHDDKRRRNASSVSPVLEKGGRRPSAVLKRLALKLMPRRSRIVPRPARPSPALIPPQKGPPDN